MVSTASVGFTDGAYREYTKGVFADQDCFIRVRDLDRDITAGKDTIQVKVYAEYKVEKKEADDTTADPKKAAAPAVAKTSDETPEEPQYAQRRAVTLTLTETEAHSGIFVGSVMPHAVADPSQISASSAQLVAMNGDDLVIEYLDENRADSPDPKVVKYKARLLMGQIRT